MPEPIDIVGEDHKDPRARLVAICAVAITVAVAAVGYLQNDALKVSTTAEVEAQRLSARALAEADRAREQRFVQLDLFKQQQLDRRAAALAFELSRFSSIPKEELRLQQAVFSRLAQAAARRARELALTRTSGVAPIVADSWYGPDRDLRFPFRFLTAGEEDALALIAKSDAATQYARARGDNVSAYIAIIAIFAVAIYLFGFTLTPHGRANRPLLATTASVLAVVGIFWGIVTLISSPDRASDQAAAAYGRAEEKNRLEEYDDAIAAYGEAIDGGAGFPTVYKNRAVAYFLSESPQTWEIDFGVNLTSPRALRLAIDDWERARELGLGDSTVLSNLSFSYLSLGIQERDPDLIREALDLWKEVKILRPDDPVYGAGVGYLALGERERAFELFEKGAMQIAYVDVPKGKLREEFEQEAELGSAMTDLELLTAHYPDLAGDVRKAKELIVDTNQREIEGGKAQDDPRSAADSLGDLKAYTWAGGVEFSVTAGKFNPNDDRTWVEWYRKQDDLGWFAMPTASGAPSVEKGEEENLIWNRVGNRWFVDSYYLKDSAQPVCLPPARYRVELYVNGWLAASDEVRRTEKALKPARDSLIGYRLCRPADWQPADRAQAGLINGFTSANESRGVYVVRLSDLAGLGGVIPEGADLDDALARVFDEFRDLLPARPGSGSAVNIAFLGHGGELVQDHSYEGGRIRTGISRQGDGSLFIGLVFAPDDDWYDRHCEPCEVFSAISEP